jgi:WD40 repeat protein
LIFFRKEIKKKLFAQVLKQQMNEHKGAVWVMKFNYDGLFLASGGEDKLLRIWRVIETGMKFP